MKKFHAPFIGKKAFKIRNKSCYLCREKTYEMLDVHRIKWGAEYSNNNCVCLCVSCHRKVHNKLIIILGWRNSTCGRLLHIINSEGKEDFL